MRSTVLAGDFWALCEAVARACAWLSSAQHHFLGRRPIGYAIGEDLSGEGLSEAGWDHRRSWLSLPKAFVVQETRKVMQLRME